MPCTINAVKLHAYSSSRKFTSEGAQNELAHVRRVFRESSKSDRNFFQTADVHIKVRGTAERAIPGSYTNFDQVRVGINDLQPNSDFAGKLSCPHFVVLVFLFLLCAIAVAGGSNILYIPVYPWQIFLRPFRFSTVDCRLSFFYASPMFGKPRQVETETELYEAAVRALMRRPYSVYEMKQLLGRRTEDDELLKNVMDRLKRAKMIDDERFAKQFVRQRTEIRRQGKFRIARDLRARGVPDRHIEAALAESAKETDEAAIVRQRLERKLRSFRGEIDERKMAAMYRSLLRAGFSADVVRRELKSLTREEVPDAEPQSEE